MSRDHATVFLGDFFQIAPGAGASDRAWTVSIAIEPSEVGRFLTEVGTPPRAAKYEASQASAPSVLVLACPRRRGSALSEDFVADTLAKALLARLALGPVPRSDELRALTAALQDRFA